MEFHSHQTGDYHTISAWDGELEIVYLSYIFTPEGCCLEELWVEPRYRRQGLAGQVMTEFITRVGQEHLIYLYAHPFTTEAPRTRPGVLGLKRFYRKFGFVSLPGRTRRMARPADGPGVICPGRR